jgi:hypothetical protein
MTCGALFNFLLLIVLPIVSLYLCVERFRQSQKEKQPWTGR